MTPKVSIVVATKNRPDYLFRCLLAIKLQSFQDWECIIVGDHCQHADNVYAKDFWQDDRFKFFNLPDHGIKNVGAIGKNLGIEMAEAPYICYCNDDDILWQNHVATHLELLTESGKQLSFSTFYHLDFGNAHPYHILNRKLYFKITRDCHITDIKLMKYDTISMMHTKQLAIDAGMWKPWAEVGYNEDRDFINRMIGKLNNDFIISEEITATYYAHWKDENTKEHGEYVNALKYVKPDQPYVFPQLIDKLKKEYGHIL